MGSKQFGFELSAWSLRPGVSLALGGILVVVIIMAATAIFLICYYWAALVRKAMSPPLPAPPPPRPPPPPPPQNYVLPVSEYKILMKLVPPLVVPPSTVVLMPGEDLPTFLAMPCHSCSVNTRNMQDKEEQTKANMGDAEVKVEVYE